MRFSDRLGLTQPPDLLQSDTMDEALKNSLWNVFFRYMLNSYQGTWVMGDKGMLARVKKLWEVFLKRPLDTLPAETSRLLTALRQWFENAKWWEVYNLIEFCAADVMPGVPQFISETNIALEREQSAYRFVGTTLVPISSEEELQEVREAMSGPYGPVREHLRTAADLLAKRPEPDHRNSVKESISAVESLAKIVSGKNKATLDDALKVMAKSHAIHPALGKAFSTLYGYSSDQGGVRHALIDEAEVSGAEARFMLIACSAFVNYVVANTSA